MLGRGIARHGYPIHDPSMGAKVGDVTSGTVGPTVGKNIGLGYVPATLARAGRACSSIVVENKPKPRWWKALLSPLA